MSRIDDRFFGPRIANIEAELANKLELQSRCDLTVSGLSGDDNTGDGSRQRPFETIGRAVAAIPKVHAGNVTITIMPGVYELTEPVEISDVLACGLILRGEEGGGEILIRMENDIQFPYLVDISRLSCNVDIKHLSFVAAGSYGNGACLAALGIPSLTVHQCKFSSQSLQEDMSGILTDCSRLYVAGTEFNNLTMGIEARSGLCISIANRGTGNEYGISLDGAVAICSGTQPSWNVAESQLMNGGRIFA